MRLAELPDEIWVMTSDSAGLAIPVIPMYGMCALRDKIGLIRRFLVCFPKAFTGLDKSGAPDPLTIA